MRTSFRYSQNFLRDSILARNLIEKSGIASADIVVEIGAGTGVITRELLKCAGKVIVFEVDKNLAGKLAAGFQGESRLEVRSESFLNYKLPNFRYKVFSNIPFSITSEVIKKLTFGVNPPAESFLFVQKEAALKFAGDSIARKNSEMAVILYPWFKFEVVHTFQPYDFIPKPGVDVVLLKIVKRMKPLVDDSLKSMYRDFVAYIFSRQKQDIIKLQERPSEISFEMWIGFFEDFLKMPAVKSRQVQGFFENQRKEEEKIEKIKRTRVDKDWREFRNG